jgi:hypothetical protein
MGVVKFVAVWSFWITFESSNSADQGRSPSLNISKETDEANGANTATA